MPVSAMYYPDITDTPDITGTKNWIFNGVSGGGGSYLQQPGADNLTIFSPIVFERPISFDALSVEVTGGTGTQTTSVKGAFYGSSEFGLPGTKIEHTEFSRIEGDRTKTREPITFEDYIFPAGIYWLALRVKSSGNSDRRITTLNPTFPGIPWLPLMASNDISSSYSYDRVLHLVRKGEWEDEFPEDISFEGDYFNSKYTAGGNLSYIAFGIRVTPAAKSLTYAEEVKKV